MGLFGSSKKKESEQESTSKDESNKNPSEQKTGETTPPAAQDMPELPEMPSDPSGQDSKPLEEPFQETPGQNQENTPEAPPAQNKETTPPAQEDETSFEVPDFSDEDLDIEPDKPFPEKHSSEPEPEPEELPKFSVNPPSQPPEQKQPQDIDSLKKEVFSDETSEKPEVFIEKKRYGRLLLSEERLMTTSKELLQFTEKLFNTSKEESEINKSVENDYKDIQRELMAIDTQLFEKEDAK